MRVLFFVFCGLTFTGCSTLDESMRLGAVTGILTGVSAIHTGYNAVGLSPTSQEVTLNAGLGAGIGLLAAYMIHESISKSRELPASSFELHFGDLPPSPFEIPAPVFKKGGR